MIPIEIEVGFDARATFALSDATLLVLANVGSDSHGTKLPSEDPHAVDDVDYMGVVVPPAEYVLGVENWEGVNFWAEQYDCVFYSLDKFVRLLLKANPNVVGTLWLRPTDLHHSTQEWLWLMASRSLFSTKEAYGSFAGYASGQMYRMTHFDIETQKVWERALELIDAAGWTKDDVLRITSKQEQRRKAGKDYDDDAITAALPMPDYTKLGSYLYYHPDVAQPTVPYIMQDPPRVFSVTSMNSILDQARVDLTRIHARHFQGYMGEKRKALVQKYGFDVKNAAHLIRLLRMGVEFLQTGSLRVYRDTDREYLMQIKRGEIPLDVVKAEAEKLFADAKVACDKSPLPDKPDRRAINELLFDVYFSCYNWEGWR